MTSVARMHDLLPRLVAKLNGAEGYELRLTKTPDGFIVKITEGGVPVCGEGATLETAIRRVLGATNAY